LIEWFTLPILRSAEGYWPGLLRGLRSRFTARLSRRLEKQKQHWQLLAEGQQAGKLNAREIEEYARLDFELAKYPVASHLLMPTRLGNLLRAAEEYPYVRYGLEVTVTWPRLWLILPESTRKEVAGARQALDERTRIMGWGLLFTIWSIWAWWSVVVALSVTLVAYRGMLSAAALYGELLRATFDLYRFRLYKSLNWPVPTSPADERGHGEDLTEYLHRGIPVHAVRFKLPV
jgi:hypothetical protein